MRGIVENDGSITPVAAGQRIAYYTEAGYAAAKAAGTNPKNCCVAIIDDFNANLSDEVVADSEALVKSSGIYDAIYNNATITTNNASILNINSGTSGTLTIQNRDVYLKPFNKDYYEVYACAIVNFTLSIASNYIQFGVAWDGYTAQTGMVCQITRMGFIESTTAHSSLNAHDNYIYTLSGVPWAAGDSAVYWIKLQGLLKKTT